MIEEKLKSTIEYYLNELSKFQDNGFDIHKDNLVKKLKNTLGTTKEEKDASFLCSQHVELFLDAYIKFRSNIELHYSANLNRPLLHRSLIAEFIEYKTVAFNLNTKVNRSGKNIYFTAQSKYEPTILEEFLGHFLRPIIYELSGVKCGPVKAYSEISLHPVIEDGTILIVPDVKTKDQDFSIYTEQSFEESLILQVPLVSIECKTYIDKTMLESALSTAQRIKRGCPKATFYIVSETYDIGEDAEFNPHEIDNIFILRKSRRTKSGKIPAEIDPAVLTHIYNVVESDIQQLAHRNKPIDNIINMGRLKI